jgi:hypothetical protein
MLISVSDIIAHCTSFILCYNIELFVSELNGTVWTGVVMTLNRMLQEGRKSIYTRMDVRFSHLDYLP